MSSSEETYQDYNQWNPSIRTYHRRKFFMQNMTQPVLQPLPFTTRYLQVGDYAHEGLWVMLHRGVDRYEEYLIITFFSRTFSLSLSLDFSLTLLSVGSSEGNDGAGAFGSFSWGRDAHAWGARVCVCVWTHTLCYIYIQFSLSWCHMNYHGFIFRIRTFKFIMVDVLLLDLNVRKEELNE